MAPEIKASNLPTKDSTNGKKSARQALAKKKIPETARPENPILPDLYHVNFLYFPSRKKNRNISSVITPNPIKETKLESLTELIRKIIESQKNDPKIPASKVSKNFRFNLNIEIPRPTMKPTIPPQNQRPEVLKTALG